MFKKIISKFRSIKKYNSTFTKEKVEYAKLHSGDIKGTQWHSGDLLETPIYTSLSDKCSSYLYAYDDWLSVEDYDEELAKQFEVE